MSSPQNGPISLAKLKKEDLVAMMEGARPYGGRRRDGYFMALQRTWWVNILYYIGIQALDIPEILENVDPGLLLEQNTFIANHILRYVYSNVARLSQARADWSVIPNSPDQVDQQGAKFAQHLLDHTYDQIGLQQDRLMIGLWLDICGTCFYYTGWNPEKGLRRKIYVDPLTQQPVAEQHLMPQQKEFLDRTRSFVEVNDGDFDVEVLSPFQVSISPKFTTFEKMPWMLIRRMMSLDEVWDRWPKVAPSIGPEDMSFTLAGHFWGRLPTLAHRPGLGLSGHMDNDEVVVVDELTIPPSKRFPEGMTLLATKRQILEVGPHKMAAAGLDIRFPVVDFHNKRVPGRFHSMSTVEHLIGAQRDYNRARQQIIQQRDVLSVPQWLVPQGAVRQRVIRNEFGDWLEYNPRVGKPELQNPPALGDAQVVSAGQAQNDMQMMAAFSEASLGQNPQGARSGNAVQSLQERDQLAIAPTISDMEKSFEKVGQNLLKLAWKNMKLPRAVTVYGESRQADVKYFKGSDLNGNTHVKVKPGSMMPKSKAQTFELITALLERGALNPADPKQQRMILDALEVGGADKLFLCEEGSARRARIENLMYSKPEPRPDFAFPDVSEFDDHQVHYEEHYKFFLTDEYELLDPMRKLYFQAHMQKHLIAVAQQMQALQLAGGVGSGSPQAKELGQASPPKPSGENKKNPMETA